ncbi:MAG: tRNA lysidine(34) synthetase TilS [Sulfurospirillum sp.]|nr:tRNA lysidine(34) synthetase TilS [Sulfurospirillum sp.]
MQQLPKLCDESITLLKRCKNLLAYSAGSDSNALFTILQAYGIEFDIAIINYKTRMQSDSEESYAKALAKSHHKTCYSLTCKLEQSNFEHNARVARYAFFEQIIRENGYDTLITAHHLNDKFEWFLMQLSKGAGLVELLGFEQIEERQGYKLIRPLLMTTKENILYFLEQNNIQYFLDHTNEEQTHERNRIRAAFATPFLHQYAKGVLKSFTYLHEDATKLLPQKIYTIKELSYVQKDMDTIKNLRAIDKMCKNMGYLLSKKQRDEITKTQECIIASKIAVAWGLESIFVCPHSNATMPKKFKELCRTRKIPTKIRPYLFSADINPNELH